MEYNGQGSRHTRNTFPLRINNHMHSGDKS